MPANQVDISSLDPRQLQSIQEQIENEINNLAQSSVALQRAAGEYGSSGRALEQLAEQQEGLVCFAPVCPICIELQAGIHIMWKCRSANAAASYISCVCDWTAG